MRCYDRLIKGKIRHVFDASLFSADAVRFIHGLGIAFGNKLRSWRIPSLVLKGNEEIRSGFLSGFFDSEGSVRVPYEIMCYSTNYQGLVQVSLLLKRFRIPNQISSYAFRNKNWSDIHILKIKREHSNEFTNKVNFQLPRKRKVLKKLIKLAD